MHVATTMLYRAASEPNPHLWDRPLQYTVVPSSQVEAALKDGWVTHPDLVGAEPEEAKPRRGRPPKTAEAA